MRKERLPVLALVVTEILWGGLIVLAILGVRL